MAQLCVIGPTLLAVILPSIPAFVYGDSGFWPQHGCGVLGAQQRDCAFIPAPRAVTAQFRNVCAAPGVEGASEAFVGVSCRLIISLAASLALACAGMCHACLCTAVGDGRKEYKDDLRAGSGAEAGLPCLDFLEGGKHLLAGRRGNRHEEQSPESLWLGTSSPWCARASQRRHQRRLPAGKSPGPAQSQPAPDSEL